MKKNYIYGVVMLAVAVFALFYFTTQIRSDEDFEQSLQFVIEYEDGSTQTFSSDDVPFLGNSIVDSSNKVVKSLRAELYVKVDYTGSVTSWDADGTLYWQVLDSTKKVITSVDRDLEPNSGQGAPPKNTPFVLSSATISASGIEAMWSGWQSGQTYYLRFAARPVNFQINFSDGTAQTEDSYAVCDWKFKYEGANQLTSLQVTWQPVAYY